MRSLMTYPSKRGNLTLNNAGGLGFKVNPIELLDRFLILGSEDGTYYVGERELTEKHAENLRKILQSNPLMAVGRIAHISEGGMAKSNEPALFALALATSIPESREYAWKVFPDVVRTGTHLLHFVGYMEKFRKWGSSARRAINAWFLSKTPDELAFQVAKYQGRDGWTMRDVLRKSHPSTTSPYHKEVFDWVCGRVHYDNFFLPMLLAAIEGVKACAMVKDYHSAALLIEKHGLSWEMVPTELLNYREVWEALVPRMPLGALIRQLPKLTQFELIDSTILNRITNQEQLTKARMHPLSVLVAQRAYTSGTSKGGKLWTPNREVIEALSIAFDLSFKSIVPTGKKILLAVDCSGSMQGQSVIGIQGFRCSELAALMAMVTLRTEPFALVMKFDTSAQIVNLDRHTSLAEIERKFYMGGGTDCGAPIKRALQEGLNNDGIVIYTDNESWFGPTLPYGEMEQYRKRVNPLAKCVSVAMASNQESINPPDDPLSMNVVGFDTNAPRIISQFLME